MWRLRQRNRWTSGEQEPLVILDNATCRLVEVDLRGTADDVVKRLPIPSDAQPEPEPEDTPRGPGRPKLGVVAREVTLLPRHWEWLNGQPGGASVALRKLVEDARRSHQAKDRQREAGMPCIASCRCWRAISRASRRLLARCLQATRRASTSVSRHGRRICAIMPRCCPVPHSRMPENPQRTYMMVGLSL